MDFVLRIARRGCLWYHFILKEGVICDKIPLESSSCYE